MKSIFKKIVILLVVLMVFASAALLGIWQRFYNETPGAKELLAYHPAETSVIYDRTGKHKLYEVHGLENRKILDYEEIPQVVRLATLAAEDNHFYYHRGFDLSSIVRAILSDLKARDYEQGASTITQQLARNIFLSRERTWKRKIKELAIAIKIEKEFSKKEILNLYLNQISYGADIYGIEAAAQNFFHKPAKELSLGEAATLASLPKATTFYSPYGLNKDKLLKRQRYILDRMETLGWAEKKAVAIAKSKPIEVYRPKTVMQAPHFVFYVLDVLKKEYGERLIYQGGLKIYTSLDYSLQKKAESLVAEAVAKNKLRYGAENSALVALNPKTGEVLAMVGSADYYSDEIDGEVNVALSKRQPGSAFKPIAYAKAFEKGLQPETLLFDVPTDFGPDGSGKNYRPNNYNGKFRGLVSLKQALAMSLNIPAVKVLYLAGIPETIELAERLGITTLTRKNIYGLSLVLGGGEVNLLELTGAYAVFANDGKRAEIDPIIRVVNHQGKNLAHFKNKVSQVIDPQVARKINKILSDNNLRVPVFGKNNSLFIKEFTTAAKTGTTQEYKDAWTIGYAPSLAVGVWSGNNDSHPMKNGAAGIYVSAPLWQKFTREALKKLNVQEKFINYQPEKPFVVEADKHIKKLKRTVYFNKKTRREISFNESMHLAQDLVEKKIVPVDKLKGSIIGDKSIPIEFSQKYAQDKMVKRWRTTAFAHKKAKKSHSDKKKKKKKKK